jgi:NACalpha-BTF3-like transcription factor
MEQETIELVASLTGGKFSRKQIAEALKQSSQDPDDAI